MTYATQAVTSSGIDQNNMLRYCTNPGVYFVQRWVCGCATEYGSFFHPSGLAIAHPPPAFFIIIILIIFFYFNGFNWVPFFHLAFLSVANNGWICANVYRSIKQKIWFKYGLQLWFIGGLAIYLVFVEIFSQTSVPQRNLSTLPPPRSKLQITQNMLST